jgi:DMSO/TMAO reductase YedYZ molybdopterin-dependent catalytic subunit
MTPSSQTPPRRSSSLVGFVLGAATGLVGVSVLYVASRLVGLPFAPFDVFEAITRWLPGKLITAGIDLMVSFFTKLGVSPISVAAKAAEKTLAVLAFVSGAAVAGAVAARASRRVAPLGPSLAVGAAGFVVIAVSELSLGRLTLAGLVAAFGVLLGWSVVLAWSLRRSAALADDTSARRTERRRFLGKMIGGAAAASSALLAVAAVGRGRGGASTTRLTSGTTAPGAPEVADDAAAALAGIDANRPRPVRGTRAELTPNDRFYRIDIDLEPPRVDAATWRLRVDGLVATALDLTLDDIRALPRTSQNITLECISNPLGGDLVSTSRWTGVPLVELLRRAAPSERARTIHVEAADGFYESLTMAEAQDRRVLLVYEMNGVPLPVEHGFPLRIYIPNRHGMKQPKWITRLRLGDDELRGYWVDRGWSKEAIVKTTSVIDTVGASMMLGAAEVLGIGGMALAGARGISKVEVQVDDGAWQEAQLVAPPLGPLTWVLWRYDWPYRAGRHTFRVRAYDGTGALQPTVDHGPRPDGASGIHTVTMNV